MPELSDGTGVRLRTSEKRQGARGTCQLRRDLVCNRASAIFVDSEPARSERALEDAAVPILVRGGRVGAEVIIDLLSVLKHVDVRGQPFGGARHEVVGVIQLDRHGGALI